MVPDEPNLDAVCFHAQQCAEKLLKGLLVLKGEEPPRIHDLVALSRRVARQIPSWTSSESDLRFLTGAGMGFRYPGDVSTQAEATRTLAIAEALQAAIMPLLDDAP